MQLINTKSDMAWLRSTHCASVKRFGRFNSAVLHGNEDCPSKVELYEKIDPLCTDVPVVLFANDEGELIDLDRKGAEFKKEIRALLIELKKQIDDEYRCSDDPDDNTPGMQVTVSTNDMESWSYQTGDTSYTGGCYGCRHWAIIYLYRRSNCASLAADAVDELASFVAEEKSYQEEQKTSETSQA